MAKGKDTSNNPETSLFLQHQFFIILALLCLSACLKEPIKDIDPYVSAYDININDVVGDTVMDWRVPLVAINLSGWNPDSNRYEPSNVYNLFHLTHQRFRFQSHGYDNGTYYATDTLAKWLRIPTSGTFLAMQGRDRTGLTVQFQGDSTTAWLILQKGDFAWNLTPNTIRGYTKYVVGSVEYYIKFLLNH